MNWSTSFEWSRSARVLCNALMKADALLNYWHRASFTHCQKLVRALCTTSFITGAQSAHIGTPFESRVCIYTCCHYMFSSCLHNRNHTRCSKCEARSDCVWMCGRVCGVVDGVKITSFRLWQSHREETEVLSGQERPHPVWVCWYRSQKTSMLCFPFFFLFFVTYLT